MGELGRKDGNASGLPSRDESGEVSKWGELWRRRTGA